MLLFLRPMHLDLPYLQGSWKERLVRKTETLRNLSIPQWSLTHRLPGLGYLGLPQLLLVLKLIAPCKRLRAELFPGGVEISILALTENTLRLEYPWTAVLEEPKYQSTAAVLIIKNLFPLDYSGCGKLASRSLP